ncbi:hypothetical protein NB725_004564 [Pantoea ananatis]|nr:hypothetical protein [Pantoea ananatis]MCW0314733.1 hypothetical protein [Pantoea ananatis]MCW0341837.1 hypothetical protein [Pantoea ananatis]MCW0360328.1 hypothetical protein [Pantoea ananatis]MCW0364954.1 hypothetical protein [Pantoea ananatis]
MFRFIVGLILNIAPAQGAGIQNIAVFVSRAGNDSPVELRVVPHGDLIATFTGKQSRLLFNRVEIAVDFIFGYVDVC